MSSNTNHLSLLRLQNSANAESKIRSYICKFLFINNFAWLMVNPICIISGSLKWFAYEHMPMYTWDCTFGLFHACTQKLRMLREIKRKFPFSIPENHPKKTYILSITKQKLNFFFKNATTRTRPWYRILISWQPRDRTMTWNYWTV